MEMQIRHSPVPRRAKETQRRALELARPQVSVLLAPVPLRFRLLAWRSLQVISLHPCLPTVTVIFTKVRDFLVASLRPTRPELTKYLPPLFWVPYSPFAPTGGAAVVELLPCLAAPPSGLAREALSPSLRGSFPASAASKIRVTLAPSTRRTRLRTSSRTAATRTTSSIRI